MRELGDRGLVLIRPSVFPLFWIIGSCILLTPLSAPAPPSDAVVEAAWMPEKTEEERARIVAGTPELVPNCVRALAVPLLGAYLVHYRLVLEEVDIELGRERVRRVRALPQVVNVPVAHCGNEDLFDLLVGRICDSASTVSCV